MNRSKVKTRKSYTLSPESVAFLDNISRATRAASVSSVLDDLIQRARSAQERDELEQAVTDYYSKLSNEEATEQTQWGHFALDEFPHEELT